MTRADRDKVRTEALGEVLADMDTYVGRTRGLLLYRIGRRGAALLFFAFLDAVYAFSLFNPPAEAKLSAALKYIASIAPLWVFGTIWAVSGALCLVHAFRINDRIGFAAAICVKTLWGLLFLGGAIVAHLDRAYVSVALWLSLAAWVAIIASWPEPAIPIMKGKTLGRDSEPPAEPERG